jgi:hypothetical protein
VAEGARVGHVERRKRSPFNVANFGSGPAEYPTLLLRTEKRSGAERKEVISRIVGHHFTSTVYYKNGDSLVIGRLSAVEYAEAGLSLPMPILIKKCISTERQP